jgi:hypothetical protein
MRIRVEEFANGPARPGWNQVRCLSRPEDAMDPVELYALDAALSAGAANPSRRFKIRLRHERRWSAVSLFRRAGSAATFPIHPAETSIAARP